MSMGGVLRKDKCTRESMRGRQGDGKVCKRNKDVKRQKKKKKKKKLRRGCSLWGKLQLLSPAHHSPPLPPTEASLQVSRL